MFEQIKNMKFNLAATPPEDVPLDPVAVPEQEPEEHTFTKEQWDTLTSVLELESTATPDDVISTVTALAEATNEQINKIVEEQGKEVKAAAANQPVLVDGTVWNDMQQHLKTGLRAHNQQHRGEAEQVVDQAIRLGKASANDRERWISAYDKDKETTVHALNRGKEIPRMEIGYGIDPQASESSLPNGWVR
ncbi:phage protease [Corynebacterium sp. S7]